MPAKLSRPVHSAHNQTAAAFGARPSLRCASPAAALRYGRPEAYELGCQTLDAGCQYSAMALRNRAEQDGTKQGRAVTLSFEYHATKWAKTACYLGYQKRPKQVRVPSAPYPTPEVSDLGGLFCPPAPPTGAHACAGLGPPMCRTGAWSASSGHEIDMQGQGVGMTGIIPIPRRLARHARLEAARWHAEVGGTAEADVKACGKAEVLTDVFGAIGARIALFTSVTIPFA